MGCSKMGKRGPKPRFLDVACPNEQCNLFGIAGKGNVTVYGTYTISSGKVRKYICHTCGTRFCDRTNTAFYDSRTNEEKIGSSLYQVGRLNCNFPSLRYIISMIFFVVLKPLALLFADWTMLFIPSSTPLDILVSA